MTEAQAPYDSLGLLIYPAPAEPESAAIRAVPQKPTTLGLTLPAAAADQLRTEEAFLQPLQCFARFRTPADGASGTRRGRR